MKKQLMPLLATLVLALSGFVFVNAVTWKIGDNYAIKFDTKGASGIFNKFDGQIVFDETNLGSSKFQVALDVNSINTGNGMKNRHAKSNKWFDADKYPQITFISKDIKKTATGYSTTGLLDIHGVSKEITFPFVFDNAAGVRVFKGTFSVNRADFGIGEPGGKVDDAVNIDVAVPVTQN